MKINAAPDSLVTAEFTISCTLADGAIQRGRIDMLALNFNEDAGVPARFAIIFPPIMDDAAGLGVTLKAVGMAPLTEEEARHNIFSQYWFEIHNLSGDTVVLDEVRVIVMGYPAFPVPNGFARTDPDAIVTSGTVTVKDKDGVTISSVFIEGSLIGATGPSGVGLQWRNDVNGGTWQDGTAYAVIDAVRNGSPASSYRCTVAHTAGATTEPGVGVDWATVWKLVAEKGATGATGADGNVWRNGPGAPSDALGANNDYYLDTVDGEVYKRTAGTYASVGNIKGLTGDTGDTGAAGAVWRNGSGAPDDGTGVNGDYYLRSTNGDVYLRAAGTYNVVANIKGPQGDAGPTGDPGADGVFSAIASQAEAEAGTDNTKGMTPLRVAQAIAVLGIDVLRAGVAAAFDTFAEIATALALKAPLASPTFTGTPAAPTPTAADNSTKIATTAYVDSANALKASLAGNNIWTGTNRFQKQYYGDTYVLTDAATIALDWDNGNVQRVVLGGNRTFTFANPKEGARYVLKITQDGTGSRVPVFPTIKWQGGVAPTLTTTLDKTDVISLLYIGGEYLGNYSLNY